MKHQRRLLSGLLLIGLVPLAGWLWFDRIHTPAWKIIEPGLRLSSDPLEISNNTIVVIPPKRIDLLFAGKPDGPDTRQGIYQFQNDLLVICLGTTAGFRPTEFQKGERRNHILLVRPTADSKQGTAP